MINGHFASYMLITFHHCLLAALHAIFSNSVKVFCYVEKLHFWFGSGAECGIM